MRFRYVGIDKNGQKVQGEIEADVLSHAKTLLKSRGVFIEKVDQKQSFTLGLDFVRKIDLEFLGMLSREVGLYMRSGIPLNRALSLILDGYHKDPKQQAFLGQLSKSLDEGKGFYDALIGQKSYKIPSFYLLSIKASENLGVLDQVLDEMSGYLEEQVRLQKETTLALVYPLFILITSFGVLGFLLSFVVPKIVSVYTDLGKELPTITKIIIVISEFLQANMVTLVVVILLGVASSSYFYRQKGKFTYMVDAMLLKLPFVRTLILFGELGRFASLASILARAGIGAAEAIVLCSEVPQNSVIKKGFQNASKRVIEGEKLSAALQKNTLYEMEQSFIKAVALAEETSQFALMMGNLSLLYRQKLSRQTKLFLALLEPAMMLLVGAMVGFIVAGMLLPIFTLNIG